jgi:hypothetical protein
MSSEERQRILKEAGHGPAEAEKEEGARSGREQLARQEAEREVDQPDAPDGPAPTAEDDPDKPRPRR